MSQPIDLYELMPAVYRREDEALGGALKALLGNISIEAGNVVGIMPHPERAIEELLGSADGRVLLGAMAG